MAKAGAQEDGVAKSEAVQGVGIAQAGEEIGRVTKPDQGAKMTKDAERLVTKQGRRRMASPNLRLRREWASRKLARRLDA